MLINRETDYAFRLIRNMSEEKPTSISSIVGDEHITAPIAQERARQCRRVHADAESERYNAV